MKPQLILPAGIRLPMLMAVCSLLAFSCDKEPFPLNVNFHPNGVGIGTGIGVENDDEICPGEETAWAAGERYNVQGNWATFTPFTGASTTMTLYAAENLDAGTVTIESTGANEVTITIVLADGWSLASGDEAVKIQGYEAAPSGNPAPGLFQTYKGSDLVITSLEEFAFYGIHLEVCAQGD